VKKEEIIEGNKLIAEFMGIKNVFEYTNKEGESIGLYIGEEDGYVDYRCDIQWIGYNDDWNQLMPVIEKVKEIKLPERYGNVSYSIDYAEWIVWHKTIPGDLNQAQFISNHENLLEANFDAVVEFIRWYNENK
jgi:hypothetical protein